MRSDLSAKEARDKADASKESYKELKADYDKKFEDLQGKFEKLAGRGKKILEGDDDAVDDVKKKLEKTRNMATDLMEKSEEFIKEHPVLVVGGAFIFGYLLGALNGRKSRD
jgi:ElaB/YqjD/DUF883 family membrane-anchored ribosome-binding protein